MTLSLRHRASVIRACTFFIWLLILVATPIELNTRLPPDMITLRGLGGAILSIDAVGLWLQEPGLLRALRWSTAAMCALTVLWPRRLWALAPIAAVAIWVLDAYSKGPLGYAPHSSLIPLVTCAIMAAFCHLSFASPIERPTPNGSPSTHESVIRLAALAVVIPYTFVGIARICEGGLHVFYGEALPSVIAATSARSSPFGFGFVPALLDRPGMGVLVKSCFALVTLFELLSVGVFVSRRFRISWIVIMTLFHVGTLVSMNIFFWENLALIHSIFWHDFTTPPDVRRPR